MEGLSSGLGDRCRYVPQSVMNVLAITSKGYEYEIDGKPYPQPHVQCDFSVDGGSLAVAFGFEDGRPWFGQTCFETVEPYRAELILQLRGIRPSNNQFNTNRFVLYRCHCGDDNCGIISCGIERAGHVVRWTDLRYEADLDLDEEPMYDGVVPDFVFDAIEYDSTIERFAKNGT